MCGFTCRPENLALQAKGMSLLHPEMTAVHILLVRSPLKAFHALSNLPMAMGKVNQIKQVKG